MTRHDDKGTDLGVLVLNSGDQSSGELLFEKKRLWLPGPHLRPMGLALPLLLLVIPPSLLSSFFCPRTLSSLCSGRHTSPWLSGLPPHLFYLHCPSVHLIAPVSGLVFLSRSLHLSWHAPVLSSLSPFPCSHH